MVNLYTQEQVRQLAVRVGFTAINARIASAIAMAEAPYQKDGKSYVDFDAVGDKALANNVWGYSYGGFQVRSLRAQKGTGEIRDELALPDPHFNVTSARRIKLQLGWTAWSTYASGMYKAYLQDLYPPPPNTYVVVGGDTLSTIAAKLSDGKWTWKQLADANGIRSPYTIKIGQRLQLPQ